jgi:hypothetical protein
MISMIELLLGVSVARLLPTGQTKQDLEDHLLPP